MEEYRREQMVDKSETMLFDILQELKAIRELITPKIEIVNDNVSNETQSASLKNSTNRPRKQKTSKAGNGNKNKKGLV